MKTVDFLLETQLCLQSTDINLSLDGRMIPLKCQTNPIPLLLKAPQSFSTTLRIKFKSLRAAPLLWPSLCRLTLASLLVRRDVRLPWAACHPSPSHCHWGFLSPGSIPQNCLSKLSSSLLVTQKLPSLKFVTIKLSESDASPTRGTYICPKRVRQHSNHTFPCLCPLRARSYVTHYTVSCIIDKYPVCFAKDKFFRLLEVICSCGGLTKNGTHRFICLSA